MGIEVMNDAPAQLQYANTQIRDLMNGWCAELQDIWNGMGWDDPDYQVQMLGTIDGLDVLDGKLNCYTEEVFWAYISRTRQHKTLDDGFADWAARLVFDVEGMSSFDLSYDEFCDHIIEGLMFYYHDFAWEQARKFFADAAA